MSRNLHTQVTSGYHDAVRCLDDFIDIFYTFCIFNLGNNINTVPAILTEQFFNLLDGITVANKGCCNKVDPLFNTEKDIFFILLGNRRQFHINIRNIDTFSLSQFSAVDDPADNIFIFNLFYRKLNQTIINQNRIARFHIFLQSFIRLMTDGTVANHISAGKRECIAFFERHFLTVLQKSCTYLRSFGIKKNCDWELQFFTDSF